MDYTSPGRLRSAAELRRMLQAIDAECGCVDAPGGAESALRGALTVPGPRPFTVGNRFAVHPMEGWDATADGLPTEPMRRRWRRFGESGAKLIWGGEAFAVQADGRANPNQLYLNPKRDMVGALADLRQQIVDAHGQRHGTAEDLFIGLQLTHSGRFARPIGPPAPRVAYRHPILDGRFVDMDDSSIVTDGELEGIGENFVRAARVAWEAGFQFVDVKSCHSYLLNELLSAHTRPGRYGGSFENRTRFLCEVVQEIRANVPELTIGVRLSVYDGFPHVLDPETGVGVMEGPDEHLPYRFGFGVDEADPRKPDLNEPVRLLNLLRDRGVSLINVTEGSPYHCPHILRPAAYPPSDGYRAPEDPLQSVARHLQLTRACKRAVPALVYVGSGYTYLQEWLAHVAEYELERGHVDIVGMGRMTLSYPQLAGDVLAGRKLQKRQICRTFSDCTTAPRNGMASGCYPLDPYYKSRPEAQAIKALKQQMRKPAAAE